MLKKIARLLQDWLPDLADIFTLGGLTICSAGVANIHGPSGLIVLGAGLFWLGIRR